MKARHGALAGLLATAAIAAGAAPVDIAWMPVDAGPVKSPHGAMLVPVVSGGIECRMQIDTGMPTTVFYRGAVPTAWLAGSTDTVTAPGLAVGGTPLPDAGLPFFPGKMADDGATPCSATNPDVLVGTIGLDSLKTGAIVVDMAAGRFEFIPHGVLSATAATHASLFKFADAPGAYGSLPLLELIGRAGARYRMWLDTGNAPMGASFVRERDWLAETSEASRSPAFESSSWGRPVTGQVGRGRLEIVSSAGTNLVISDNISIHKKPDEIVPDSNPLSGFLGLLPFEKQRLTIDFANRLASVEPGHANP